MLNIRKILLPVDSPNISLRVVHQAATLAHHFRSEIVMLHAATDPIRSSAVRADGPRRAGSNTLSEITRETEESMDHSLGPEIGRLGLACRIDVRF